MLFLLLKIFRKELNLQRLSTILDFLISNDSKVKYEINPIEVKASKNYTTTSLGRFKEVFGKKIETQIIIHPKNFSAENDVIKIPPYMLWCMF